MTITGPSARLTIFISEDDQYHHKPLYHEIVHRAHSSRVHTTRILSLAQDLPVAVIIVDAEDKIRAFLPQLDELVSDGLVIIDPVEVIRYVGRPSGAAR